MEERLRTSIVRLGFYKPVIVRELPDGTYQILGGEHRWRVAKNMGLQTVPVVNLGPVTDKQAKVIGLADNGQYGNDDSLRLAEILRDIGREEIEAVLPYSDADLAGMFAATEVDLDNLGFDEEELKPADDLLTPRATVTHELMRFKVPVEDRERVQKFIEHVIQTKGLKSEEDSMVAAGMALVEIVNAAKDSM